MDFIKFSLAHAKVVSLIVLTATFLFIKIMISMIFNRRRTEFVDRLQEVSREVVRRSTRRVTRSGIRPPAVTSVNSERSTRPDNVDKVKLEMSETSKSDCYAKRSYPRLTSKTFPMVKTDQQDEVLEILPTKEDDIVMTGNYYDKNCWQLDEIMTSRNSTCGKTSDCLETKNTDE